MLPKTQIMYIVTKIYSLHLSFFHLYLNYNRHMYHLQKIYQFIVTFLDQLATHSFTLPHIHISLPPTPLTPRELNGVVQRAAFRVLQYCTVLYCFIIISFRHSLSHYNDKYLTHGLSATH